MEFAALHIRTGYSFLKSGITLENAFAVAQKQNYFGFGLTDTNSLTGFPVLYKLSKNSKIKPAYGVDIEYNGDVLSLYCIEEEGYRNMLLLSFEASRGQISFEFLRNHCDGLALILDIHSSKLTCLKSENEVKEYLALYERLFSIFYLGLPYGEKKQLLNNRVREFVKKYPYPLIAFPHMLYEKKEDAIILEITHAIETKKTLTERKANGENYFLSLDEISTFYTEEEIANTKSFIENLSFTFLKKRGSLLKFDTGGLTSEQYLKKLAFDGLKEKIKEINQIYEDRLNYELDIISSMGYADYFLIVKDYCDYARKVGIYVGPGRGSGAGSLVAYALGITKVDSVKHNLLFERFLNPQRQSMPDLDIDFADYRRDEIVNYVLNKYGKDRTANIVTIVSLGPKGAIQDIGRVFSIPQRETELLSKSIVDPKKSLKENYKLSQSLKDLVNSEPQFLEIVSLASKIENMPRQSSFHPAGIILNNTKLYDCIPVKYDEKLGLIAQYEHDFLEEQGFLKMDILSLRNLSIVEACLNKIYINKGLKLNYEELPYDDEEAIKTIRELHVAGLFQLESNGMKNANAKISPTHFNDIVALISLFRPGPLDEITTYAKRKSGKEPITYLVPELEPILKETYGVIVVQEQVMQMVQTMAGFSFAEADLFRRAIAKKDANKLSDMKVSFLNGCEKKGYSPLISQKAYDLIFKFANYGLNKSHALSYAMLSSQMAYLKTHFPNEFYAAIFDFTGKTGESSFLKALSEMKNFNIKLALPSINDSECNFAVKNNEIVLPFTRINGIHRDFANKITAERHNNGPFTDFYDFILRAKPCGLDQPTLVRLIDAGCFDSINPNRCSLRASSFDIINYADMLFGEDGNRILLDFNFPQPTFKNVTEIPDENMKAEKEAIGILISSSPLSKYRQLSEFSNLKTISDLDEINSQISILGIIGDYKTITTKKGSTMAFVNFFDEQASIEITIYEKEFNTYFSLLKNEKIVLATIKPSINRTGTFILDSLKEIK